MSEIEEWGRICPICEGDDIECRDVVDNQTMWKCNECGHEFTTTSIEVLD